MQHIAGIKSPPPLLSTVPQPVPSKTTQPVMEDEYVEMDSVPAELPGKSEPSRTTHGMYVSPYNTQNYASGMEINLIN